MILPMSTATAEHTFSDMKQIKDCFTIDFCLHFTFRANDRALVKAHHLQKLIMMLCCPHEVQKDTIITSTAVFTTKITDVSARDYCPPKCFCRYRLTKAQNIENRR